MHRPLLTQTTSSQRTSQVTRGKKLHLLIAGQPHYHVLKHVRELACEGPLGPDAISRLFERIIDEARRLERRVVHGDGAE